MGVLPKKFYNRNTLIVAQELLGCFLVRRFADGTASRYLITETEAYRGLDDLASHASRGRTGRNAVMFGPPGRIYIYLVYGLHHMLNIVTGKEDYPAAVLIRGGEKRPETALNGPGKLTRHLGIGQAFNGLPIYTKKHGLFIEGREQAISPRSIKRRPRVGVDYAGEDKDKLWRFILSP